MSDRQYLDSSGTQGPPDRQPPQRPPIQWPVRDTASPEEDRAAQLARQRVEQAYTERQPPGTISTPPAHVQEPHVMRTEEYDWQKYHTAWQQYYHQYFYRYYAGWWQQQKAQLEASQSSNTQPAIASHNNKDEQQRIAQELREKVRSTVEERTDKLKKSTHFKPLIAAFTVAFVFLFINYNQVLVGALKQYVAPGSTVTTPIIVEPNTTANVGPEPKIIIPKIGVDAPVVYDEPKVDEASFQKALERGVVRLGTTANPGTKGNIVIGGHSSNNVFNPGKFKYVFVNLKRLDVSDIIYLNYGSQRYTYKITVAKKIITPKDTSALRQTDTPLLTLFTCDPPGTNVNRLIVQATQIDPSPDSASANLSQRPKVNASNPLPSVAPSIWDRILSIL